MGAVCLRRQLSDEMESAAVTRLLLHFVFVGWIFHCNIQSIPVEYSGVTGATVRSTQTIRCAAIMIVVIEPFVLL